MSQYFYCEKKDNSNEESINNFKDLFLNYKNNIPSLSESLYQMFKASKLDEYKINELTNDIIDKCKHIIEPKYNEIKNKYEKITKNEAYIICSYTCESVDNNYSPYKILNQNLASNNKKNDIKNISKYLYIFLKALRKLPKFYPPNKLLYFKITNKINITEEYNKGNQKTFWGFTLAFLYNILRKNSDIKTIFTLGGDIWGYDIELFHYFGKKQILLEPEIKFIIGDYTLLPLNKIINIECNILNIPKVLSNEINPDNEDNYFFKINKYIARVEMEIIMNTKHMCVAGIGVLCNISSKKIKVLITYNHIIDLDFLTVGKKMKLFIDNQEKEINLEINRYIYTNEELDFTIIEILEEDKINNFIEIEKLINYSKNSINKNIISVSLNTDDKFEVINGSIIIKNYNNYYIGSIEENVKEGIIILKDELKFFGLLQNKNNEDIEIISIKKIIDSNNFIKCIYEIKKDDIGKDIQIINKLPEEKSKEIKIIINGETKSDILQYKFNKEGLYSVYFIFQYLPLSMYGRFTDCYSLKQISLLLLNTSLVTDMSSMFKNCYSLEEIDLAYLNTNQVNNMSSMFNDCSSLKYLNLSSFNTEEVTDMSFMFNNCSSLQELDLSSFDTCNVTNMSYMFVRCKSLKKLNIISFNTNKVINMSWMFNNCSSLKELDVSSFNTNQVKKMDRIFANCSSLEELNLSSFNTNQITDMSWMFSKCSSLKKLNLISFNTFQVTHMSYMFGDCSSLEELDLSSFNTYQVTDMSYMFGNCSSLKKLNLISFNTNKVIDMSYMFYDCSSLEHINLNSFNTYQVINISHMFENCSSLKELNLSSFNTNKVTNMSFIFHNCSSLQELNLSSFNFENIKDVSNIFYNQRIYCKLICKNERVCNDFYEQLECIII